jgi:hypothetical protein
VEFNGVLLMAALWFLLSLLGKSRRKPSDTPRPHLPEPLRPRPLPGRPDVTQQEGSRLELVLRELQRSLEEAAQPAPLPRLPTPETVELERQSLEAEPEVVSLEGEVHRKARERVDRDDQAGSYEAQRIEAATLRDSARTQARQAAIPEKIRREVPDHTATRAYTPEQLRHAVVWREILSLPVALRPEE